MSKKIFLAIPWLLLLNCASPLFSSNTKVMVVSEGGVYVSYSNGRSFSPLGAGLPKNVLPIRLYYNAGDYYLTTFRSGLFRLDKNKSEWVNISSPDFRRRSQSGEAQGYRKISALAFDPVNPDRLALATKHTIYVSNNRGLSWKRYSNSSFGSRNYITALTLNSNEIIVGTSFNGIFRLVNNTAIRMNRGLPQEPYSGDTFFTEQIHSLGYDPVKKIYYAGAGFGKGAYYFSSGAWKKFELPSAQEGLHHSESIEALNGSVFINIGSSSFIIFNGTMSQVKPDKYLEGFNDRPSIKFTVAVDESGKNPPLYFSFNNFPQKSLKAVSDKRGLYVSIPSARKNLNQVIDSIVSSGLNAVVIDMKDDFGNIYYPTNIQAAKDINAAKKPLDIVKTLSAFKAKGIYTIARIVTFKDEKLYRGYNNKYAIKNSSSGGPWKGTQHEYWVDPHSAFVQNYNIEIAKELETLGFDEIQFDYIRFPSDGPVHQCNYTFKEDPDMYKSEIITDFLIKSKRALKIPVSADIYGFNSWYHFGNWIGQDMEELSFVADAICPMVYPSHFGSKFYRSVGREEHPFKVVYDGGKRSVILTGNRVDIRPYLQAFKMMSPTWGPGYIRAQADGARRSGLSGYIFWNAKGEYQTVIKAFTSR